MLFATMLILAAGNAFSQVQGVPQQNVNTGGPTPFGWLDAGNVLKQMNEPSCAVSSGNTQVVVCGMNDYSGVDPGSLDVPGVDPTGRKIGDSWAGIAISDDGARSFIRGLNPCHLEDFSCSLGMKYGADPNLSFGPGILVYSTIVGWRDGSAPGGIAMSTWAETNTEASIPLTHLSTEMVLQGTDGSGEGGTFLDKPGQAMSLIAGETVTLQIPDPNNPGATQPFTVPSTSVHFVHTEFVGNDNNSGTKVIYNRWDDYDFSNAALTTKITEGIGTNQGAQVASRYNGNDVLIVWRRFQDVNEKHTMMYVTCNRNKCTKPAELAQVCAHDQPTGWGRFRSLALPVVTTDWLNWYVFYSDRGDGNKNCLDDDGAPIENLNGVEARKDYSRIMMAKWDGARNSDWEIQPVDDRRVDEDPVTEEIEIVSCTPGSANCALPKVKGNQILPAVNTAAGVVQLIWSDNRDSRLYRIVEGTGAESVFTHADGKPTGLDRFIEDFVFSDDGLWPSSAYETAETPIAEGRPYRHDMDVWGRQFSNGNWLGDPFKVSRYAVGRSPFTEQIEQLEHSWPNQRLFAQGTRAFFEDYGSVATPAYRWNDTTDDWESNAPAPMAGSGSIFNFPTFYAGFTDHRYVRGNVYFTGCDDCPNDYQIPNPITNQNMLIPLEGAEDPSVEPAVCVTNALSRNQKVVVAPIRPGLSLTVVSARKPEITNGERTFVLYVQNSTPDPLGKTVILTVPDGSQARWNKVAADADPEDDITADSQFIEVFIYPGSGAVRTLYVQGPPDGIIVTATDLATSDVAQALINGSIESNLEDFNGVLSGEDYTLDFLTGRIVSQDFENQDFENQDFENSVLLQDFENQDLENQDFENTSILQDLENQDFENLLYEAQDLENQDFENQDFENRALLFQDLENQDLENQDLENATILFQDLENQDLENGTLGDEPYVEVSWPVKTGSNTTVGVNAKVLAAAGATTGLTTQVFVTQSYLTHTVTQSEPNNSQFCTPQLTAQTQVLYNAVNMPLDSNPEDPGVGDPGVVSFFMQPGSNYAITVRVYGDTDFNPDLLGAVAYAHGAPEVDCSPEQDPGSEAIPGCEIDFDPDTTAPVLSGVPTGITTFNLDDDKTTFTWSWGVNATDEDPNLTVACPPGVLDESPTAPAPPDYVFSYAFPVDDTIVNCSAADTAGNEVIAESFTVRIVDVTDPLITAPADITVDATAYPTFISDEDLGTPTYSDAFPVTITRVPVGNSFNVGLPATTVTWKATDANDNYSTDTQIVTVIDQPPDFSVDQACTLRTDGTSITVADWAAECPDSFIATDTVDGSNVDIACTPNVLALGFNDTVSCDATDQHGNTSDSDSLTVTVEFAYIFELDDIKSNIRAGSTVPLRLRYIDRVTGLPIDSSAFNMSIRWTGPFDFRSGCSTGNINTGDGEDAGTSRWRVEGTDHIYSWQTPDMRGDYEFVISPPGTAESTDCASFR
jgi:hypothetical protein